MQSIVKPNNKKLFVWHQGYSKTKGVPPSIEVLLTEAPTTPPGMWTLYRSDIHGYPPTEEYALPKELYFEVSATHKITLDFMGWHKHAFVVSESMLEFLRAHGLTDGYEVATVKNIVNRKGKVAETIKKYFVLRFIFFHDDLLDFHEEDKLLMECGEKFKTRYVIFPNMCVKEGVKDKIFILRHTTFFRSLVFTEEIRDLIKEKGFIGPPIYAADEFYRAFPRDIGI